MSTEWLPLVVALPLLVAFLLQPLAHWLGVRAERPSPVLYGLSLMTIAATLWITLQLGSDVIAQPLSVTMGGFNTPVGINLYLDGLAYLLLLATQLALLLLWPAGAAVRTHVLLLVLAASSMGLALSGDLFNLYVFYELLAVATFGLIAASPGRAAPLVSFRYLLLSGMGSVLALSGIALIYSHSGSLNLADLSMLAASGEGSLPIAAFLLILVGFGVKAELFAVNSWVPEVYSVTSSRFAALLAGVVSKLAVVMIVRILLLLFPQPEATDPLLLLGILGLVSGELAAWRANDFRRMLAYSSIGQLGMIFIAFSLSLELGLFAGLALSFHHMVVKPGLFLLLQQPLSRWRVVLLILFALSLVGVPPLPGFWAKLALLTGLVEVGGWLNGVAAVTFLVATVVEAGYLFRIVQRYYQEERPIAGSTSSTVAAVESPWGWEGGVALMLGGVLLAVTLTINPVTEQLQQIALQSGDRERLISTITVSEVE
ncbi:MAG: NADH-quinone oxidoreductase subunit J [Gammaproteobacteria bacterium]|jgi:formate hydrogenlyase subunit 3/multisubunit Na+/H+ antiporter MnhD subunit|nr:NADH-quinone oxidoreductase subunit J [Gammaproteobacteria bacterium]